MERKDKIVDILMDDDEIEVVEEVEGEKAVDAVRERDLTSGILYRNAVEVGSDMKLRILDIAIVVVALILAYMIYTEVL